MSEIKVGVIGGSGLYDMDNLTRVQKEHVPTPFGEPSDAVVTGLLDDVPMVFLPRHGRGHRFSPSEINYRANIYAMKSVGVTHLISVSACGSLREEIEPGHIVVIDQFFDRTKGRDATFFGDEVVAHVSFADPVCADLRKILVESGRTLGVTVHDGGTYVCMEGPAFSTRAESHFYRLIGAQVIGMTNLTEAKLAREAALPYATLALATDYDCWRTSTSDVNIQDILTVMKNNVTNAKRIIAAAVSKITPETGAGLKESLRYSVVTAPDAIPGHRREELEVIWGDYFDGK